jgi:ADP-ribosyl-[dinitrogen reductase] hydrolase
MSKEFNKKKLVADALIGVAVGDALGVPFEFSSREKMKDNPARDMVGYGTYNQKPGTWSDDTSLTLCLAESLAEGIDLMEISKNFIRWRDEDYWTARNQLFDIGVTTSRAISRLKKIIENNDIELLENQKFHGDAYENGNGSLMRIIPLLFPIINWPISDQFDLIWKVSALTHRHIRAAMSCLIYLKLAENIISGMDKEQSYQKMRKDISSFWNEIGFSEKEQLNFTKLVQNDIKDVPIDDLRTGGYVIEVLESSIWFFMKKGSYCDTVLSIINLGHDTDTAGAIAGGLAGLYYGADSIPSGWLDQLARKDDILLVANQLSDRYLCNKN